jgi:hypothetical protein
VSGKVPVKAGKELRMKEPYGKGLPSNNHHLHVTVAFPVSILGSVTESASALACSRYRSTIPPPTTA